jgi:hypothetical protein
MTRISNWINRLFMTILVMTFSACGGGSSSSSDSTTTVVAPSITTQPVSITVNVGANANFSVAASGSALTYQWYKAGVAISGATSSSLALTTVTTSSAGSYTVAVANSAGSVSSSAAVLTVTDPTASVTPTITTQPASVSVASGGSATFTVVASGSTPLTYQWFKDGVAISGATAASYVISSVATSSAGIYTVTVTNSVGTVTSTTATLTVTTTATAPTITTQPASVSVAAGSDATFSVVAAGTATLAYQWQKDGTAISGATSASLTLSAVTSANAGAYTVVVTNAAGSVTSSSASLTVTTTSSGSNTAAVVTAANAFKATLSTTELATTQLSYTKANATFWTNLPVGSRNGLKLGTMSTTQLAAAKTLIQTALGTAGVSIMEEIRLGDEVIHLSNTSQSWGYNLYYVALIGTPSTSSPWMLQISGHHLAFNITYNATVASATPTFLGTEPTNWTDSSSVAHAPVETLRAAVSNLATAIQADSTVSTTAKLSSTFTDVVAGATGSGDTAYPISYPTGTTGRGVLYGALSTSQKALVRAAIEAWVATQASDISAALLAAYESDTALAGTYVGYGVGTGGTADFSSNPSGLTSQHSYLRIDGPRVWIEFVVQQGVAYPTKVHYHTVWRDKTADYGAEF